ncbi:DUF4348 domain-containing protein [Emticicia sp. C21]|uniref:DUF4348 domain-containing protein n=1 Tax=Emticicia sp. C21 TaxID=2302915 RepID=UPI000E344EC6|nr:DUF4348 domain-containing protein [Emticicia sp. C21]RFS17905.1 DUF4348 domain-containing protein [Emticicia sp. C21]
MKLIAVLLLMTSFFIEAGFVHKIENNEENFDKFFKNFCKDDKFQLSRIKFPLKVVVVDEEKRNEKTIQQNDWRHTDLLKLKKEHSKNKLETLDKAMDSKDVVFTNKDNGEIVHHLFSNIDNQWYLTSIVDESE